MKGKQLTNKETRKQALEELYAVFEKYNLQIWVDYRDSVDVTGIDSEGTYLYEDNPQLIIEQKNGGILLQIDGDSLKEEDLRIEIEFLDGLEYMFREGKK